MRNVIERCFGLLKARFPILKQMPNYKLARQSNIVLACCAIHNFIIRHQQYDDLFEEWANNEVNNDEDEDQGPSSAQDGVGESSDQNVMHAVREEIANQIWANRR